jgi:hypothetical protein
MAHTRQANADALPQQQVQQSLPEGMQELQQQMYQQHQLQSTSESSPLLSTSPCPSHHLLQPSPLPSTHQPLSSPPPQQQQQQFLGSTLSRTPWTKHPLSQPASLDTGFVQAMAVATPRTGLLCGFDAAVDACGSRKRGLRRSARLQDMQASSKRHKAKGCL